MLNRIEFNLLTDASGYHEGGFIKNIMQEDEDMFDNVCKYLVIIFILIE